ncbi:MAG: hypothetical protein LW650_04605 [Planctomycetaceae bacterium]|jgi:hypothetical protein|nr:hypothetical protein [Phycisphaerales bacterium]MCE2652787.1 hypothetical protein [Planctomycetaceae bacterium]
MPARIHPIRRRFAWVFALLAGLLLLTHIATVWFNFYLAINATTAFVVGHGAFGLLGNPGGLDSTAIRVEPTHATSDMFWWFERSGIMGMGYAVAPLWLPTVLFAALAGLMWYLAARTRPGRCPNCGYNLQGLPAAQPCPECGRILHASQPAPRTHPQQPPGPAAPRNPSGPAAG